MLAYAESIELFLANGTAESLITVELSNCYGKAIKIPRIEVVNVKVTISMMQVFIFLLCSIVKGLNFMVDIKI